MLYGFMVSKQIKKGEVTIMELMRKIINLSVRPLKDFPGYYITREEGNFKGGKKRQIKKIQGFATKKNEWRVNLKGKDGKYTTKQVHTLVYSHFKLNNHDANDIGYFQRLDNKLVFLDGDFSNCRLDNLITVKELKEFYLKNKS